MEGRQSNFGELLADFRERVDSAKYIAVDCELTGTGLPGQPDSYEDGVRDRLAKLCDIAERHVPTQIGFTIAKDNGVGGIIFHTYNVLAFPGPDRASFECQPDCLRFLRQHGVDLNLWVDEGVRYVCRESAEGALYRLGEPVPCETGLLMLWQALIEARRPLVFHGPLDLLFLLSAFERRKLPRDPKELGQLVQDTCTSVYDTALLHLAVPGLQAKPQKLEELLRSARAIWAQESRQGRANTVSFELEERTDRRYGSSLRGHGSDSRAHEAGFDSLLTAVLFAYLWALKGTNGLKKWASRLFLFRSSDCLDLGRAARGGQPGVCAFAELGGTVLVATLMTEEAQQHTTDIIARAGQDRYFYRKMDDIRLLVFVRGATDEEAVQGAKELASKLHGIHWQGLDQWRSEVRSRRQMTGRGAQRLDLQQQLQLAGASPPQAHPMALQPFGGAVPVPQLVHAQVPGCNSTVADTAAAASAAASSRLAAETAAMANIAALAEATATSRRNARGGNRQRGGGSPRGGCGQQAQQQQQQRPQQQQQPQPQQQPHHGQQGDRRKPAPYREAAAGGMLCSISAAAPPQVEDRSTVGDFSGRSSGSSAADVMSRGSGEQGGADDGARGLRHHALDCSGPSPMVYQ